MEHNHRKSKKTNNPVQTEQKDEPLASSKRKAETNIDELAGESDSYDEQNELTQVKIGKVPYGWYDEFKHFGYDNKLNPVQKKKNLDKIQEFIQKSENPNWWRTIRDELNGKDIVLTDEQLHLIDRIRSGKMVSQKVANTTYSVQFDHHDPFPIHAHPPSKKNFTPSKWEQIKVNKILDGLLTGRIKWNRDQEQQKEDIYDIWGTGNAGQKGIINIAPMKQKLPGHNESYNPPKQYLLTKDEIEEWEQLDEEDRPYNFLPKAFDKMRKIPFYDNFIQQRFQRCLDLYLCPRVKKKKLNIDPDQFIPKLPDPSTLKPFPTSIIIIYDGHTSPVISMAVSPTGQYLATGDESGLICIWEVLSSRKLFSKQYENQIGSIDWSSGNVIGFSHGDVIELMLWKYSKELRKKGESIMEEGRNVDSKGKWVWYQLNTVEYNEGFRVRIEMGNDISHLQFQKSKGDYFVSVCPDSQKKNQVISIHRITTCGSENNFLKAKGIFKKVYFYPNKPQILILTNSSVILFSLVKLEKLKQLTIGGNTASSLAVHPHGGYIIVGTETHKLLCYDLNLQTKPYKTMEYHDKGITQICIHREYPLMASSSNDGTVHVFHFKINDDVFGDPVLLPLKVLKGHTKIGVNGVKNIKFHPKQPWIFSCGWDHKVFLWG